MKKYFKASMLLMGLLFIKEFSGVAVKVDEKHDVDKAIADFKKVKGVTSVNKDGIMQLQ